MRESFVFHAEYIEDLPAEYQSVYAMYAIRYGIYEEEPELSGLELTLWVKIKRRIDHDTQEWENTKNARSESGRKGGLKSGANRSTLKQDEANASKTKQNEAPLDLLKQDEANEAVNVFVNESVIVNDDDNVCVGIPPEASAPSSLTAPQENYSKQVFELFKTAGLPCQNGDLFRFQCVDFKNSLQKLKGYSSAEVLQTIKNYIYELQHPDSWDLPQLSFSSFVGSRTWEKCTPANYRHENFLDFKKHKGRNTAPEIKERLEKCPACGKESLKLIENGLKYKCQDCGKIYTWEEINL